MIEDITRTLAQLPSPRLLRIFLISLAIATAFFAVMTLIVAWVLKSYPPVDMTFLWGWIDLSDIVAGLGVFASMALAYLLFPAVALTIQSFFLDAVAETVEAKHYPGQGPARDQKIAEIAIAAAQFALITLIVNILLLPFYLLALFFPPFFLVIFAVVNGYLLGREFFEAVAFRRLDPVAAKVLRQRNRFRVWTDGVLMGALFAVPILNLAAPLISTVFAVHRFQRLQKRAGIGVTTGAA